jgi:hypothetical protein
LDQSPKHLFISPRQPAHSIFYDLGIGIGSLTLGPLLDLTNQQFSIMYAATAVVALLGLWIYWLED